MNKDIIDLLKMVWDKEEQLNSIFGDNEFLGYIIDDITKLIAKEYNIDKSGEGSDYFTDLTFGYCQGEMSKKSLINKLKKFND